MPHFFISTIDVNKDIIIVSDKENFHHIAKVLRVKIGETLLLIDENRTQYKVEVKSMDSKSITTKVVESCKSNHFLNLRLYLACSVLKTDAQNLVIQKAAELGVKGIIPFVSDNSVIKESVADSKIEKWQKIANEAAKQCERTDYPIVSCRKTLEEVISDKSFDINIACVERIEHASFKEYLRGLKLTSEARILVIIGPEGGFSARELKMIEDSAVVGVSLGKMILRAETAVITALSNIVYELEND